MPSIMCHRADSALTVRLQCCPPICRRELRRCDILQPEIAKKKFVSLYLDMQVATQRLQHYWRRSLPQQWQTSSNTKIADMCGCTCCKATASRAIRRLKQLQLQALCATKQEWLQPCLFRDKSKPPQQLGKRHPVSQKPSSSCLQLSACHPGPASPSPLLLPPLLPALPCLHTPLPGRPNLLLLLPPLPLLSACAPARAPLPAARAPHPARLPPPVHPPAAAEPAGQQQRACVGTQTK